MRPLCGIAQCKPESGAETNLADDIFGLCCRLFGSVPDCMRVTQAATLPCTFSVNFLTLNSQFLLQAVETSILRFFKKKVVAAVVCATY